MPDVLPRLKPDPIPKIRPVPEYEAAGALAETYARTKKGLSVPWMGVVAMAFARYPRFYARLWDALEPVVSGEAFGNSCRALRERAETEAGKLDPPDIVPRLLDMGYGKRELEEIRACNEVFSGGNMPYVLMATLARLLLEGHDWPQTGGGEGDPARRDEPVAPLQKPVLMEAHHADPATAAIYADIRATLGLPFVNTDYRAFARWPSYFGRAWPDLKEAIASPGYPQAVQSVHEEAVRLAHALPNPSGLTPGRLRAAAEQDSGREEVLAVVRLFQWLLPGLATNVAFLRAQL